MSQHYFGDQPAQHSAADHEPGSRVSVRPSLVGLRLGGNNSDGQLGTGSIGTRPISDVAVPSTFTSDGSIGASAGFGGTMCGLDTGTPVVVKGIP